MSRGPWIRENKEKDIIKLLKTNMRAADIAAKVGRSKYDVYRVSYKTGLNKEYGYKASNNWKLNRILKATPKDKFVSTEDIVNNMGTQQWNWCSSIHRIAHWLTILTRMGLVKKKIEGGARWKRLVSMQDIA